MSSTSEKLKHKVIDNLSIQSGWRHAFLIPLSLTFAILGELIQQGTITVAGSSVLFLISVVITELIAELVNLSFTVYDMENKIIKSIRNEIQFLGILDKLQPNFNSIYSKRYEEFMPDKIHHKAILPLIESVEMKLSILAKYMDKENDSDYNRALYALIFNERNWDAERKQVAVNRDILTHTISTLSKLTVAKYNNDAVLLNLAPQLPSELYSFSWGKISGISGNLQWISEFFEETINLNSVWRKKYPKMTYLRVIGIVKNPDKTPYMEYTFPSLTVKNESFDSKTKEDIQYQRFNKPILKSLDDLRADINNKNSNEHTKWYFDEYNLKREQANYVAFDELLTCPLDFLKNLTWVYAFGEKEGKDDVRWDFAVSADVTLDSAVMFLHYWDRERMYADTIYKDQSHPSGAMMPDFFNRILDSRQQTESLISVTREIT